MNTAFWYSSQTMRLFLIDYENVNASGLHGIGQVAPEDRVILFYSHAANTLSFEIMDEMLSAGIMPERVCLEHSGKNALDFQLVTFLGYLIAKDKADAYFIISRDSGYQAAINFCQTYLGVKVTRKPSLKAALEGLPKTPAKAKPAAEPKTTQPEQPREKKAAIPQPVVKKKQEKKENNPEKKRAPITLRKKTTVIQVQPVAATPVAPPPQNTSMPIDLETVLSLVEPKVSVEVASEILHCLQASHSKTEFHNALQQHFENETVKRYYHCMKPCFSVFTE